MYFSFMEAHEKWKNIFKCNQVEPNLMPAMQLQYNYKSILITHQATWNTPNKQRSKSQTCRSGDHALRHAALPLSPSPVFFRPSKAVRYADSAVRAAFATYLIDSQQQQQSQQGEGERVNFDPPFYPACREINVMGGGSKRLKRSLASGR